MHYLWLGKKAAMLIIHTCAHFNIIQVTVQIQDIIQAISWTGSVIIIGIRCNTEVNILIII